VTIVALCLAGPVAWAQARVDEVGEQLVNDFIDNVITLQGRFEQSLIDADGIVQERSSGTLEIERPGRFRWSYFEPYEQWLVADGLNIWSYDVDLAQVTVKPQAKALANTPALLLGGSEDALSQFIFDGFERMELGFMNGQLTRMVFFDNLDQTTLVALYDVTTNEPIDSERFEFQVPDDADLVGTPVMVEESSP
jgi:outer membrane lipoprotein carrier protein